MGGGWRYEVVIAIRLKDIKTLELLVQDSQGLEFFGLFDLDLEPVLYFILALFFKIPVFIVKMSVQLE